MSALQRKLAKAAMESHNQNSTNDFPWPPGSWQKSWEEREAGTYKAPPPPRFPVIITPDGPISSAKKLRQLLELDTLPETIRTTQVAVDNTEIRTVDICHVSFEEKDVLEQKADVSLGVAEGVRVMFQGTTRFAMTVNSLKPGVELQDKEKAGEKRDQGLGRPGA